MSDMMTFPKTVEEFMEDYKVIDTEGIYMSKGAELVPIFRMRQWVEHLPSAEKEWIPVKSRPMDEDERIEWSERLGYNIEYEEAVIYVSQLPDDGEEVLTCDRFGTIRKDTFSNDPDYGCYFEENGDMDGIVAWMPLPKPYKEEQDG